MIGTKIGEIYTYPNEKDMLKMANKLETEGYRVIRSHNKYYTTYTVEVIGYR